MRRRSLLVPLLVLAACGPADRPAPTRDRGPGPAAASDPLGAALHRDVVAHAGPMEEVGDTERGTLSGGSAERSFILPAGYCYAILARVGDDAGELSLRLVDSNGDPRQLDRERGVYGSIGLAEPLCPEPTTEFRLELRASGDGPYAVRLFRAAPI